MESQRRRLLLADDSITIQKVVTLTFSDEGIEVVSVGAGDEAIRVLEESGPPDIVLADVHMPGLSGYEVCERIKQDARWRHVPVVLLAGAFEPFDVAEARRVGADEVLSKPFQSIRNLIGKVGSLLGGSKPEESSLEESQGKRAAADAYGTARHEPRREESSHEAQAAAASQSHAYDDVSMDDELIEATPAEKFGAVVEPEPTPAPAEFSGASRQFEETSIRAGMPREAEAFTAAPRGAAVEAKAAQPAFATRAASADDALLDLGGIDAPPSSAEADEFVLDLDLDEPPPPRAPRAEMSAPAYAAQEGASWSRADAAGAFAEAAHGESFGDQRVAVASPAQEFTSESDAAQDNTFATRDFVEPQVVPAEEPVRPGEDLSVEGDIARAPVEAEASSQGVSAERGIDPQQLSPEVIDAIARRAVELMSERVVQEIAWEVVPALAERLVKQRLNEQK